MTFAIHRPRREGSRPARRILLSADRVITGHRGQVIDQGAVLVAGDRIVWVGDRASVQTISGRRVRAIHLPGATILPGLIEGHAHLCLDAGRDPFGRLARADCDEILNDQRKAAARMVRAGVTSVRDLGSKIPRARWSRADIEAETSVGPRILSAGVPLTSPGGHCAVMGGEVSGNAEIAARIEANHRGGATWTKIMVTGGFLSSAASSPYRGQFTSAELAFAVRESRRLGLNVAAHAHGIEGIEQAVLAGVDTIEHCTWMSEDGFDLDDGVLTRLVRSGIAVGITVNSRAREATGRLPWSVRRAQLRTMGGARIPLIASTDCGVGGTPHDDLPASLSGYPDLGFSPMETIEMATSGNAALLGIGAETGSIAAGHCADLLAVHGNPLADIEAVSHPRLILARGRDVMTPVADQ